MSTLADRAGLKHPDKRRYDNEKTEQERTDYKYMRHISDQRCQWPTEKEDATDKRCGTESAFVAFQCLFVFYITSQTCWMQFWEFDNFHGTKKRRSGKTEK